MMGLSATSVWVLEPWKGKVDLTTMSPIATKVLDFEMGMETEKWERGGNCFWTWAWPLAGFPPRSKCVLRQDFIVVAMPTTNVPHSHLFVKGPQ